MDVQQDYVSKKKKKKKKKKKGGFVYFVLSWLYCAS